MNKIRNYKQFVTEAIIWDEGEGKFFDSESMEYIDEDDIRYQNMDDIDLSQFKKKNIVSSEGEITIELLRGEEVLRSFNYTDEIDTNRMDYSCCNFNMRDGYDNHLNPQWFDFYVKNPESSGSITMFENGEICGRASFFEGESLIENKGIKKGKYYKFFNVPYLYQGKRYVKALSDWAYKNKFHYILNLHGLLFIPFNTRVVEQYPPVDIITVNVKENILCTGNPYKLLPNKKDDYHSAYKLNIRKILDKNGLKLES